ncbi:autophagy-related protein 2 homolog A-like [Catharus ustulatus]|uniref:autophagy-related protein 2 homolog A-like n=1 Tax=Catharus ustulatus TaxID=91951 RepID=UPI001409EF49|nr:autophagy-related protein 2 homolog A-like [Catharus ustulatus]
MTPLTRPDPHYVRVSPLTPPVSPDPGQPGSPGSGSPPPGGSQQGRDPPPEPPPLEGLEALAVTIDTGDRGDREALEALAVTIDTVLRRLQVLLEDAELRVELPPQPGGGPGGALELHLPRAELEDAGGDPGAAPPAVLLKELRLRDARLLWQELPPTWAQVPVSPPVLGGLLPGPSELSLRLKRKRSGGLPGPAVELEGRVGSLHLLLPPPPAGDAAGAAGGAGAPG